jgi:hypothetical protein
VTALVYGPRSCTASLVCIRCAIYGVRCKAFRSSGKRASLNSTYGSRLRGPRSYISVSTTRVKSLEIGLLRVAAGQPASDLKVLYDMVQDELKGWPRLNSQGCYWTEHPMCFVACASRYRVGIEGVCPFPSHLVPAERFFPGLCWKLKACILERAACNHCLSFALKECRPFSFHPLKLVFSRRIVLQPSRSRSAVLERECLLLRYYDGRFSPTLFLLSLLRPSEPRHKKVKDLVLLYP